MRAIKRFDFEDMEDEETVLALAEAYMVPPIRTSEGLPDNIEIADMIYRNRQGLERMSIPSLLHGVVVDRFSGLASWPDEPPDEESPAPVPADADVEPMITATSTMADVQCIINAEMKHFDDEEKGFRADAGEAAIDLMSAAHRIATAGMKTQNLIELVRNVIGDADAKALGFPIRGPEDEEDSEEEEEDQNGGEDDDEDGNGAQGPDDGNDHGKRQEDSSEDENDENQPPQTQSHTGPLFALPELQLRGQINQSDASDDQGENPAEDDRSKEDREDTPSDGGDENDENQPPPSQPSMVLLGLQSHAEIIESDASDEDSQGNDARLHGEGFWDENDENQPPVFTLPEISLRDEAVESDAGDEEYSVKVDAEGEEQEGTAEEDAYEEDKEHTPERNDESREDMSGDEERPGADEISDEDNSQCEANEVANQTAGAEDEDELELTEGEARFVASLHASNDVLDSDASSESSEDDSGKGQRIFRVSFSGPTESPRSTFRREATPGLALYRRESPEVDDRETGRPRPATSPGSNSSNDDEEEDKKTNEREISRISFSGPTDRFPRQATPLPRRRLSRKETPRERGRVSFPGLMESPLNMLRRQATPGPGRRLNRDESPEVVEGSLAVVERNTGRVSFPGAVASPHNTLRRQATPGPGKRIREETEDEEDEPPSKRSRKEDSPPAPVVESERVPKRPRENDDDQEPSTVNKRSRLISGLRESMGYISSWMPSLSAVTAPAQSPSAPAPAAPMPVPATQQPPARPPSVAGTAIPPRTARRRTPHPGQLPCEPEPRNFNFNFNLPARPPPDQPRVPPPDFVLRPTEWDCLRPIPQPYWPRGAVLLTQEDIDIERRLQDTEHMYRERQRAGLLAGRNPMPRQRGFHPSQRPLSGPSDQVEAERSGFPWPPPTGRAAYDAIRRIYGDDRANPALLREENAIAGPSTFATSSNARSVSELPLGPPRPLAIPRMSTPPRDPQRSTTTNTSRSMFGPAGFQIDPSLPRRKRALGGGKGKGKAREDSEKEER